MGYFDSVNSFEILLKVEFMITRTAFQKWGGTVVAKISKDQRTCGMQARISEDEGEYNIRCTRGSKFFATSIYFCVHSEPYKLQGLNCYESLFHFGETWFFRQLLCKKANFWSVVSVSVRWAHFALASLLATRISSLFSSKANGSQWQSPRRMVQIAFQTWKRWLHSFQY